KIRINAVFDWSRAFFFNKKKICAETVTIFTRSPAEDVDIFFISMDEDDHVASAAPRNKCGVIPSNGEDHVSFSVNTNTNALAALETLNHTQQALTKTQHRVSSGLKVAGAAD